MVRAGDWAYDPVAEVWRPLALIEAGTERDDLSPDELGDLLDAGAEVPAWFTPSAVAGNCGAPARRGRRAGFVLFLTGLSGSGKSTIATEPCRRLWPSAVTARSRCSTATWSGSCSPRA